MPNTSRKPIRVALVDDHDPFRTAMRQLLEARGYETSDFNSVPSFIASGALRKTDCLVLDLSMPDIDGLALKECIDRTNFRIPVIFCTGLEIDEERKNQLCRDGSLMLQKPVRAQTLIDAIESIHARA